VIIQPIFTSERVRIAEVALAQKMPTIGANADFARAGILMSYGAEIFRYMLQAAAHIDRILKGAPAGDLPVEQPTHFELVINLKTAKAIGTDVPPSLLFRADEVIE
jgi:putative tryptophan/tyrosine transport system substrate-binding protein